MKQLTREWRVVVFCVIALSLSVKVVAGFADDIYASHQDRHCRRCRHPRQRGRQKKQSPVLFRLKIHTLISLAMLKTFSRNPKEGKVIIITGPKLKHYCNASFPSPFSIALLLIRPIRHANFC